MQITIQNATPQKRLFCISTQKLDVEDVNSIVFGAWQRFSLAAGESDYAAYAHSFQLLVRSLIPSAQHQSVQANVSLGSGWTFNVNAKGEPTLEPAESVAVGPTSMTCANRSPGEAIIGLYSDFSPLINEHKFTSGSTVEFAPYKQLYFYVSVPVVEPQQPIVFVPNVGELKVGSTEAVVRFVQADNVFEWEF